ncbi:serine palmitoyltransferase component [Coelomomyces lativittatus]|nr:serine palmitoyltransferase component [Coelomomyces lativittatus]
MDHVHPLPLHFRRPPPPPPRHPPYHDQPNSTSMRISSSSSPISTTPTPSKNTMPSHLLLPPSCPPSFHPDTSSILTSFPSKNKKTSQIPSNKTPITTIATPTSTPTSPSSSFSSSSSYLTMKTTPTLDFNNPTQTDLSFPSPSLPEKAEEASLLVYITTYLVYFVLIVFGHIRDFFGKRFKGHEYSYLSDQNGYAPLCSDFDSFFSRRIYQRIKDCWSRVIASTPGRYMNVLTRYSLDHHATFKYPGTYRRCLNLASYNYLGFAENQQCKEEVLENLELWGMTLGMGRVEVMHTLHHALESNVAKFLNTEEAMCISMGFATNSTTIPVLVNKACFFFFFFFFSNIH